MITPWAGFKKAFRDDGSVIAPHSLIQLAAIFTAELMGTALLLIIGCLGSSYPPGEYNTENYHLQSCFVFGMAVMFIIQIIGHTSTAHINPAVTLCALLLGKLRVLTFFVYLVAQVIGGILGVGVLKAMVPNQSWNSSAPHHGCCKACLTIPNAHLSNGQAFLAEFIITSILIFVVCGVWDRRSGLDLSAPLKFGFTITGLALAEGHYTGASMNPARSLAPAVWEGEFERHWIYWTAPFAASLFATLVYSFVFEKDYWKRDHPEEMSLTDIKSSHRDTPDD